jgi:hypothetical protein
MLFLAGLANSIPSFSETREAVTGGSQGAHLSYMTNMARADTGGEFIFPGGDQADNCGFQALLEGNPSIFLNSPPVSVVTRFVTHTASGMQIVKWHAPRLSRIDRGRS